MYTRYEDVADTLRSARYSRRATRMNNKRYRFLCIRSLSRRKYMTHSSVYSIEMRAHTNGVCL